MTTTEATEAAAFVDRFAAVWSAPTAQALAQLGHPEVVLVQPGMRTMRGRDEVLRGWTRLFRAMPDLRGEVHRWAPTEDGVLIELSLRATVARRPFEWSLVDRIVLEDGLVRERVTYQDPRPLALEALKAPRKWPAFVRLAAAR